MKRLEKFYNQRYSIISIYVVKTAIMIFVLGLIVYYLAGKTGGAVAFISEVLKPLVVGLVITYLLHPIVKIFEKKPFGILSKPKARRGAAVLLAFAIVVAIIAAILGLLVVTVNRKISSFTIADIRQYLEFLNAQFSRFWSVIEKQLALMNINLGSFGDMLGKIFSNVKAGASTLLFASIFAIYFLIDDTIPVYWEIVLEDFTNDKTREELKSFAHDADRVFSGYIRGQTLDAALVGTLVSITLLIARIPYAAVIGILTGIGNLVPYVGPIVGFGSLIIISMANNSIRSLLVGGVILLVVLFVDGNIINPRMLSTNVHVHPVLVIVALLAGGNIGGVVGMLVAVPIAALLKVQFQKQVDKRTERRRDLAENNTDNDINI